MGREIDYGFLALGRFLINKAFADRHFLTRKRYGDFKVRSFYPAKKSMLGSYNALEKTIYLYGIGSQCRVDIIITFIHELSHHIETLNTGDSGHQKSFYDIHKQLLDVAIEYGILTLSDIVDNKTSDARNCKKLAKMFVNHRVGEIKPVGDSLSLDFLKKLRDEPLVDEVVRIKCRKSDADTFRQRGYVWDKKLFVWSKRFNAFGDFSQEKDFLDKNGYLLISMNGLVCYTKYICISISGKTYSYRDALKNMDYIYDSDKKIWNKTIPLKDYKSERKFLKDLRGVSVVVTYEL